MRLPTYLSRLLNCLNVHLPMDEGRRMAAGMQLIKIKKGALLQAPHQA